MTKHYQVSIKAIMRLNSPIDYLWDVTPGLIKDTDIGTLHDNPTAASIFNQHVYAMDESYHDFMLNMSHQIGAI